VANNLKGFLTAESAEGAEKNRIKEQWNGGILEYWNNGMMECI
jgi:hypothetical protein